MLTGGLDGLYRNTLAAPHRPRLRIEVWKGGVRQDTLVPASLSVGAPGLVYSGGQVNATLQSRVTRQLSFNVHEDLYPTTDDALLSESGTDLKAFRGVDFGDGSYVEWQTFEGKLSTARLDDAGNCAITADDHADEVVANGFEIPTSSQKGNNVVTEIQRVIRDRLSTATFGTSDETDVLVPALTWEFDAGRALDEMATAISSFWYPLANGDFVVRKYPWTLKTAPIVTLKDGSGGTVLGSSVARSRAGVINSVTVVGERSDGQTPAFATQSDTNTASPTYVLGPFGRRSKLVQLNTPTTNDQANTAARQLLKRLKALTEAWTLNIVPDASLELGDTIGLAVRGRTGIVQCIASFTIPMDVSGTMQVNCRAQVIDILADVGGASI